MSGESHWTPVIQAYVKANPGLNKMALATHMATKCKQPAPRLFEVIDNALRNGHIRGVKHSRFWRLYPC